MSNFLRKTKMGSSIDECRVIEIPLHKCARDGQYQTRIIYTLKHIRTILERKSTTSVLHMERGVMYQTNVYNTIYRSGEKIFQIKFRAPFEKKKNNNHHVFGACTWNHVNYYIVSGAAYATKIIISCNMIMKALAHNEWKMHNQIRN